ncbi:MAG: hypothetical protein KKG95_07935 [Candidatus Omnitrophica bacterium]|nr:hypothetical protein [Candidatus Omnitrophota bacterium]
MTNAERTALLHLTRRWKVEAEIPGVIIRALYKLRNFNLLKQRWDFCGPSLWCLTPAGLKAKRKLQREGWELVEVEE